MRKLGLALSAFLVLAGVVPDPGLAGEASNRLVPRPDRGMARASQENCLRFGDVVTFWSSWNAKFLTANDANELRFNQDEGMHRERFLLIDPVTPANTGAVAFGAKVALRSYKHNMYVKRNDPLADAKGSVLTNPAVRWMFSTKQTPQPNCLPLDASGEAEVWLKTASVNKFLQVDAAPDGVNALVVPGPLNDDQSLVVTRQNWWDFYYDRPWPSGTADEPCPYRGRWDLANCLVAVSPYPAPFIEVGEFNGTATDCSTLGHLVGTSCRIGTNAASAGVLTGKPWPFVWNGSFYLTPAGWRAYLPCFDKVEYHDKGDLKGCGMSKSVEIAAYPMYATYNGLGQLIKQTPVLQKDIQSITVCYKKKGAWVDVCKKSVKYSGSHVRVITDLESNETYKFLVSYKHVSGVTKEIGEITFSTD